MGVKRQVALVKLEDDARHAPQIAWIAPIEAEHNLHVIPRHLAIPIESDASICNGLLFGIGFGIATGMNGTIIVITAVSL